MDYKEKMWKLNPFGSKESFEARFNYAISKNIKDHLLYSSYKQYLLWWQGRFGNRAGEFLGAKDEKMSPNSFIAGEKYNLSWKVTDSLSSYLKLDVISSDDMQASYESFLAKHNIL